MYTLQDALQGKPMPEEFLRTCSTEVIQICYQSMETTLEIVQEKIKATEALLEVCSPLGEGKPDREETLRELRAALDELILYTRDLHEQQLRMEKILQERSS